MQAKQYTESERQQIVEDVRAAIKGGKTMDQAVKDAGISGGSYYTWGKKSRTIAKKLPVRKAPAAPMTFEIPTAKTPMVVLIGNPADVAHALDRLAMIQGAR